MDEVKADYMIGEVHMIEESVVSTKLSYGTLIKKI